MKIGDNIKSMRIRKGMTQKDLSETVGIKIAHISRLENDEGDPKLSTLYRIMEALNCTPNELFITEESPLDMGLQMMIEKMIKMPDEMKEEIMSILQKYIFFSETVTDISETLTMMGMNTEKKMAEIYTQMQDKSVEMRKMLKGMAKESDR